MRRSHLQTCHIGGVAVVALTHSVTAAPSMWHFCESHLLIDKGLYEVEASLHLCWIFLNLAIICLEILSVRAIPFLFIFS